MFTHSDYLNFIPIVLCAGFGTRLKPLTNYIPKAACPIINKPVAFLNIEIFFKAGFEKVHCNTHYLDSEVRNELSRAARHYGYDPARIVFWHEAEILETGGGIARIYNELIKQEKSNAEKDLIVVSGDIAADFPLLSMIEKWQTKNEDEVALMCTRKTSQVRKDATWVSKDKRYVLGFGSQFSRNESAIACVFTTHQIIGKDLLKYAKIEKKSSIDMFYKSALSSQKNIINHEYPNENYWFDIGTPEDYLECINYFEKNDKNIFNTEKINYLNNQIVNYAFSIPNNLKEKIFQTPLEQFKNTNLKNQIIISFCDEKNNSKKKYLIPINRFEKNIGDDSLNKFSILI